MPDLVELESTLYIIIHLLEIYNGGIGPGKLEYMIHSIAVPHLNDNDSSGYSVFISFRGFVILSSGSEDTKLKYYWETWATLYIWKGVEEKWKW